MESYDLRCNLFICIIQEEEETRTLLQFHYTEWPCHTCPFSNAILEFRRRMRAVVGSRLQHDSPIVVHCKWDWKSRDFNDQDNIIMLATFLLRFYFQWRWRSFRCLSVDRRQSRTCRRRRLLRRVRLFENAQAVQKRNGRGTGNYIFVTYYRC